MMNVNLIIITYGSVFVVVVIKVAILIVTIVLPLLLETKIFTFSLLSGPSCFVLARYCQLLTEILSYPLYLILFIFWPNYWGNTTNQTTVSQSVSDFPQEKQKNKLTCPNLLQVRNKFWQKFMRAYQSKNKRTNKVNKQTNKQTKHTLQSSR